jgi:pyruvate dehydrogenase E2 component (dihydrolipoamide acetyltransferase)
VATEFFIHKMTEHMESARIVRWLVEEGETVRQYQPVLEVETEKATVELEAPVAGVIRSIRPDAVEGAEINVGETICLIAASGEAVGAPVATQLLPAKQSAISVAITQKAGAVDAVQVPQDAVRATPLARKVARDLGVDLAEVAGSGPNGIIRDGDVREFANCKGAKNAAVPVQAAVIGTAPAAAGGWVALNPIQVVAARRMLQSAQTAPQFSASVEADATNLLWLQEALAERVQTLSGSKLSLTALLVKIAARVLKNHPRANASYEEVDGQPGVRLHPSVDCGVAVGSENGLVVPVIRKADDASLEDVAARLSLFVEQAKTMRFSPGDLEVGTFTLSNLGMYGVTQFNAILNPPQSAILAVGKIAKRAVELEGGEVGLRPLLVLTLTADHRVLDGLQAARFLAELQARVEKPYFLL